MNARIGTIRPSGNEYFDGVFSGKRVVVVAELDFCFLVGTLDMAEEAMKRFNSPAERVGLMCIRKDLLLLREEPNV